VIATLFTVLLQKAVPGLVIDYTTSCAHVSKGFWWWGEIGGLSC